MLNFISRACNKHTATATIIRFSSSNTKSHSSEEISALDSMIESISIRKRNHQKSKRPPHFRAEIKKTGGSQIFYKPLHEMKAKNATKSAELVKNPTSRKSWLKIDEELSHHLSALLDKNENIFAFQLFQQSVLKLNVPRFDVLCSLALASVPCQNWQILDTVQSVSRLVFPEDFEKQGGFKNIEAELLWKLFRYKEACQTLGDVYEKCPQLRRKTRNLFSFLVMHAIANNNNSETHFSDIEKFAENLHAKYDDIQPSVTLWKHCTKSPWFRHQSVALKIEEKLKTDPDFRDILIKRIRNLLAEAEPSEAWLDLLHRMTQTALKLEMKETLPALMGKLLEYQCALSRYGEADETMKLAKEFKLLLPFDSCAVYAVSLRKRKSVRSTIPQDIQEPKIVPPTKFEFIF